MKSVFASPPPGYRILGPEVWNEGYEHHGWLYHVCLEDDAVTSSDFVEREDCIRAAWHDFALRFLDSRAVWDYDEAWDPSKAYSLVRFPVLRVGRMALAGNPSWCCGPGPYWKHRTKKYRIDQGNGPPWSGHFVDDLTEAMVRFVGAIFYDELMNDEWDPAPDQASSSLQEPTPTQEPVTR